MASITASTLRYLSRAISSPKCDLVKIPLPWGGSLAGKWWGNREQRPILALHGFQDNCGSFDRLVPLLDLDKFSFLCVDLPGHGWSSRIPRGFSYHYHDFIYLVRYIAHRFQWDKMSLMGHSFGATVGYLYTMNYPEDVDLLVCLEGSKPYDFPRIPRIKKEVSKFMEYDALLESDQEPPSYSMEEVQAKICAAFDNSVQKEHSHHLAERAVNPSKKHKDRYYFIGDPRVKSSTLPLYPQQESLDMAQHIKCPIFLVYGLDAHQPEPRERTLKVVEEIKNNNKDCHFHEVRGTHHFHLNNPEDIAGLLKDFLHKHHVPSNRQKLENNLEFCSAKL